jgi:hypothetical protein
MFECKTPEVATRVCVDIDLIGYFWKWIYLGISFTVVFRSVVSLVGLESTLVGLTGKYVANDNHRSWVCIMINHFQKSNTNTHLLSTMTHTIPSSAHSTTLVQRVWKKS